MDQLSENASDLTPAERFRIWCGAAWTARGWDWQWSVIDMELARTDQRVSWPGQVARGHQPSWQAAMEDAARYRRHIISERVYLRWS